MPTLVELPVAAFASWRPLGVTRGGGGTGATRRRPIHVGDNMLTAVVKRRPGRPRTVIIAAKPMSWEIPALARQVTQILDAVDAPPVDSQVRLALQKISHRTAMFGGDGPGRVTLLLRTILESDGNEDALIEPIVSAVEMAMRPKWTELGLAWIEAFDRIRLTEILNTMRGLDLFSEQNLALHFSTVLHNKLCKILVPAKPVMKPLAKPAPKPPQSLTRVR